MNTFDKKIILLIVLAAISGGIIGSLVSASPASASIWDDLQNSLNNLFNPSANQPSSQSNSPAANLKTEKAAPYSPTIDYEEAVVGAVEKSSPSVVSIIISKNVPVLEQCPYNPFSNLPPEFQQFFGGGSVQFYQPCQKGTKKQEIGGGSGFIISSDGMILTNKHVVFDKDADYTVLTNDGKKYPAKVLAQDAALDLAIVKINAGGLPTLTLGNSDSVRLGQTAIAIGNALGEFRNTVSAGVISGLARNITASGGGVMEKIEGVLQTDAAINEGNSGGPLLNLKGEVIGINVAMVSGAQNIGFAIPINQAKRAIESVKKTGKISSPFLGVRYLDISSDLAEKEKLPIDYGALVRGGEDGPAVVRDSPAYSAGIKAEDIILEVNGGKIDQSRSLSFYLQKYNSGDSVVLKILRDGKKMELKVKLGERPQQ